MSKEINIQLNKMTNWKDVRTWLDLHFYNSWIGRFGSFIWPPRSCDLTPLDFFFGVILTSGKLVLIFFIGYVKDRVYRTPINSTEELK